MPKTKLQQIEERLVYLPSRDVPFAKAFISHREIEKLYDLVSSALDRYEDDLKRDEANRKYKDVDPDKLIELYVLVSEYWDGIRLPEEEETDFYL